VTESSGPDISEPANASAPLSQSPVFPWLREFYATSGVTAWAGTVPLYVTCNPDIAHSYAEVILRFIQDAASAGHLDPAEPVYVAELGAGTGKFGFHLVRRIRELRHLLGMEHIRIVHVMSDVAESNIGHWQRHPRLQPFVARGELVFARFDMESDDAFHLIPPGPAGGGNEEQHQLAAFRNPLVVAANYVFDSVPQDLFRVSDGRIQQMLAALAEGEASAAARLTWSPHPAALPHYGDADLDAILADIASEPGETSVMFPVTAMRALRRLADAAGGRLCLLASDLGTGNRLVPEPELQVNREMSFFYLPVDFSVMGRFFRRLGPGIQKHHAATYLDTALLVAGFEPDQLRETAYAFSATVEAFGVRGRKAMGSLLEEGGVRLDPEEWLAVASLGRYDTRFLDASVDLFGRWVRAEVLPPALHREVVTALRRFAAEIYWTPGAPDTYFNMATALAALGELKAAVAAYVLSIETVGPAVETYVNLAIMLRALDRRSEALEALRDALALDPSHVTARGWLGRIELEMTGELPRTPTKPAAGSATL
jgi:Tetratricopeptide repeat